MPPLTLTVVNPDGSPAAGAVALARVTDGLTTDPRAGMIHTFTTSSSGAVSIAIPVDDPYLVASFPKHKIFNVHVTLLDLGDGPGEGAEAFAGVDYVLNLGDPSYPLDFAGVQNSVVPLHALPRGSGTELASAPLTDAEACDYYEGFYTCVTVSHPPSTQGEQVVVAHNIGATPDITTEFSVLGTVQIGTTTVTGVDGLFVENRGTHSLSQNALDSYGFVGTDTGPNEDAGLYVNFAQVETSICATLTGTCDTETTFVPDGVTGQTSPLPTSETIYHGYAQNPGPTNTDCTVHLSGDYTNSRGVSVSEDWTFGFDFEGSYNVFNLHVTSVKQNTVSTEYRNTYTWKLDSNKATWSLPYHHLFVRFGHVNTGSEAGSICPPQAPQSTWTDSSYIVKDNPAPPPVSAPEPPEPVGEPANEASREGRRQADRCTAAPERCGQGR